MAVVQATAEPAGFDTGADTVGRADVTDGADLVGGAVERDSTPALGEGELTPVGAEEVAADEIDVVGAACGFVPEPQAVSASGTMPIRKMPPRRNGSGKTGISLLHNLHQKDWRLIRGM